VEFLGLSISEILVIAIVAILVFGSRLPQVAGQAAATLQRAKRSLADLRRETGIDQEIARARREFESVRRPLAVELPETIRRETQAAKRAIEQPLATTPDAPSPASESQGTPPPPAADSPPDAGDAPATPPPADS
jgi:Sec-independent protein translocase protein TatA